MAELMTPRRAYRMRGDIFDKYGALVHQVNCVSGHYAGLARTVFARFPTAAMPRAARLPGTCITMPVADAACATTHVVSMFTQLLPGSPRAAGDSFVERLEMFDRALKQLEFHTVVFEFKQINFPRGFGCGLAGGDWRVYKARIHAFAGRTTCPVAIVKLG